MYTYRVLTNACNCVTQNPIKIKNIVIIPGSSLMSLPYPTPRGTHCSYFFSWTSHKWNQDALCVWLLSLSILCVRFIPIVVCRSSLFLFTVTFHCLFIHSLVDRHQGYSQICFWICVRTYILTLFSYRWIDNYTNTIYWRYFPYFIESHVILVIC